MNTSALPKVSALMGAYNYAGYIVEAIESAMRQDYPEDLLELVIVDDGSSDNTADLVHACMERHPGRIKFVQQQNAGATAATNRARREAAGDLIALLDADDVWLPEKTRKQVEFMRQRPELGLVFSTMQLVDAGGATIQHNYGHREPIPANGFARVLWENVAVQSSLVIEADLFDQIPADAPYADWWLALAAARDKAVDYIAEDLVLYRWHGANITGGVGGVKALREAQKGIAFQRWVIRNFDLDSDLLPRLTPEEMVFVWTGLENQAQKGLRGIGSYFGRLAEVTDEDRVAAATDVAAAEAERSLGDLHRACGLLLRARANDPYDAALRERFLELANEAEAASRLPDPLADSLGFNVVADAAFLLADPTRLADYAETMRGTPAVTLVIDASELDPEQAASELQALVEHCGLDADDTVPMLAIVDRLQPSQRLRLRRGTDAVYAAHTRDSGSGDTSTFTPESLDGLRRLAEQRASVDASRNGCT